MAAALQGVRRRFVGDRMTDTLIDTCSANDSIESNEPCCRRAIFVCPNCDRKRCGLHARLSRISEGAMGRKCSACAAVGHYVTYERIETS
jgi:hypothetical protein